MLAIYISNIGMDYHELLFNEWQDFTKEKKNEDLMKALLRATRMTLKEMKRLTQFYKC